MTTGNRLALSLLLMPTGAMILFPTAASADDLKENDPFTMTVREQNCDTNMVPVLLESNSDYAAGFTVEKDDHLVERGTVKARRSTTVYVPIPRGRSASIQVNHVSNEHDDKLVDAHRVYNDCPRHSAGWGNGRWRNWGEGDGHLPYTGPPADLMGKLATGAGLVLMGGIVWWYGSIWPRQTPDGPLTRAVGRRPGAGE
ncbi:hypothetical protein GCM10010404_47680 [Nonomuraea africana]|uniref:Uncharacterized protein n=1 Tax=Nonomuraea africana TaxID=46171 RepID=A0ABR9KW49_9ACTN|nr:hypothetical protein [Nonomuraea africana]MBE1566266.1 hypothetical protein [Nonomuraea africana]